MGGHVAVMPTGNGHALTLELGSPDLNEKVWPRVPVSSPGSVSGEAALPSQLPSHSWRPCPSSPVPPACPSNQSLGPLGPEQPNTHIVLDQLVDGHLGLQQVVVESDNLVTQSSLLFVIMLALGQGEGSDQPRAGAHIPVFS